MIQGKFFGNAFKKETPTGTINGTNKDFVLSAVPVVGSVLVFVDGLINTSYSVSGSTITMTDAPVVGQEIYCFYVEK